MNMERVERLSEDSPEAKLSHPAAFRPNKEFHTHLNMRQDKKCEKKERTQKKPSINQNRSVTNPTHTILY